MRGVPDKGMLFNFTNRERRKQREKSMKRIKVFHFTRRLPASGLLVIFFVQLLTGFLFFQTVKAEEPKITLTLQDIVGIAVKNHPLLRAGQAQIEQKKGTETQVRSNYNPQVAFQSGYNQSGSFAGSSRSTVSGQSSSFTGSGSSGVSSALSLQQLITDFGKTNASIQSAKESVIQSREQLHNTLQQVLLNVYQAYYQVLQNQAQLKVQKESVKNLKRHLNQAEEFFKVGTKPKIDVMQARVNLSNGLLALEQASNALEVSKTHLNTAIGTSDLPPYEIKGELVYKEFSITFEDALKKAFENRPDLKALMAQKKSAEDNLLAQSKGQNPTLSGSGSYTWQNNNVPFLPNLWSYGVTLNVPIYNGWLTKGQVEQAKGQLDEIQAQIDNLKLSIKESVKQSFLNLESAKRSYKVALETVELAGENFDLASQRYDVGVGSYLEFSDAQLAFVQAENSRIQTLANYNTAIASLKAAMGILE